MPVNRDPEPDPETREMLAEAAGAIKGLYQRRQYTDIADLLPILTDLCLKVRLERDQAIDRHRMVNANVRYLLAKAEREVSDLRERLETVERETEKTREREWTAIQVAIRLERERDEVAADLREKGAGLAAALRTMLSECEPSRPDWKLDISSAGQRLARAALVGWEKEKA